MKRPEGPFTTMWPLGHANCCLTALPVFASCARCMSATSAEMGALCFEVCHPLKTLRAASTLFSCVAIVCGLVSGVFGVAEVLGAAGVARGAWVEGVEGAADVDEVARVARGTKVGVVAGVLGVAGVAE